MGYLSSNFPVSSLPPPFLGLHNQTLINNTQNIIDWKLTVSAGSQKRVFVHTLGYVKFAFYDKVWWFFSEMLFSMFCETGRYINAFWHILALRCISSIVLSLWVQQMMRKHSCSNTIAWENSGGQTSKTRGLYRFYRYIDLVKVFSSPFFLPNGRMN